jgi:Cys-tRNA(Pro) deacylase
MRSSVDVHNFLQSQAIQHEFYTLEGQAKSAERIAAVLGLELGSVAKTLVFLADSEPVLVIIPGNRHAHATKIRRILKAKKVDFASIDQLLDVTDFCTGAIPPIAHKNRLKTIIDRSLLSKDVIYTSGGDMNMILKLKAKDLKHITGALVAEVCRASSSEKAHIPI